MIHRTLDVDIELSPKELAEAFCEMDDTGQAIFFSHIGTLVQQWPRSLAFQLQSVTENCHLSKEGRRVMSLIGEYSKEPLS